MRGDRFVISQGITIVDAAFISIGASGTHRPLEEFIVPLDFP
jgi:hypothetical protein